MAKKRTILRANYFFRAVELPAGNHRVEFVYDPMSFKLGLVISSLTAALLIAVPFLVGFAGGPLLDRSRRALAIVFVHIGRTVSACN